jgi:hypothetical protein
VISDFVDTIGVRAELLRIDAAMLAQASTARLLDPNDLPILTPAEFVDRSGP